MLTYFACHVLIVTKYKNKCQILCLIHNNLTEKKLHVKIQASDLHVSFSVPQYPADGAVAYPGILFGVGGQQIQLRTEDRENGDLGAAAPYSGVLEAVVLWYKKFHFI